MAILPKTALGAWAWGNDVTFGNSLTAERLKPIIDTASGNRTRTNGRQINRPDEAEIRRRLNEVLKL